MAKNNKQIATSIHRAVKSIKQRCDDNGIKISPKCRDFEYMLAEEAIKENISPEHLYLIIFGIRKRK